MMHTIANLYFFLASMLLTNLSESRSRLRARELIFEKGPRVSSSENSEIDEIPNEDQFTLNKNTSWEIFQNKTENSDWKNAYTQIKLNSLFSELIYLIEIESDGYGVPQGLIESIVTYVYNDIKDKSTKLSLEMLLDLLNNSRKGIEEIPTYTEGYVKLNNLHKLLNILRDIPKNILRDSMRFDNKHEQYLTLLKRFKSIIEEDIKEHDIPLTVIEFIFATRQKEISLDIIEQVKYLHLQNRHKNNESENKTDEENIEHITDEDVEYETNETQRYTSTTDEEKLIMTPEINDNFDYSNYPTEKQWISGTFTSNPRIFDIVFGEMFNKLKIFVSDLIVERLQDIELFKLLLEKII